MTVEYVTIDVFAELTGYTETAIRSKIAHGHWLENRVWRRAPDGRILLSPRGYNAWVEGQEYELPVVGQYKLISSGKAGATVSDFDSHRRRRISSTPADSKQP